ncbi:methylthioribulose 1-phosphate dehydratase [Bacterioplanoides sp.]|uniref:methylthioribulose 1-phosphate dehydratase n=1 Tax=Bacterioplanoides sp. TaxID=2066072 RepID=UPI003AFF8FDC
MTNVLYDINDFNQAAESLCRYGKILYQRDWSPATSSNYSIRLNDHCCALTSSGKHKGKLSNDDILVVDFHGQPIAHPQHKVSGKPSAETLLHTQLYQRDPTIGAVLHTHSPTCVVLSQIWQNDVLALSGWELQKAFAGETSHEGTVTIPLFANDQNMQRLADQVEQTMQQTQQGHAYLIRGHGVYTWGKNIEECFRHLEALEHLLGYQLQLLSLNPNLLTTPSTTVS